MCNHPVLPKETKNIFFKKTKPNKPPNKTNQNPTKMTNPKEPTSFFSIVVLLYFFLLNQA